MKMRKVSTVDTEVAIYGSKKQIEETENALQQFLPDLSDLSEPKARLELQQLIDKHNIKATILFDGNCVWSKKKILRDIRKVKKNGMDKLSDYLYKFLSLSCGSIAHYNKFGWIEFYPTIEDLKQFFRRNEFGQRVLHSIPVWKTDVYQIVEEIEKELKI